MTHEWSIPRGSARISSKGRADPWRTHRPYRPTNLNRDTPHPFAKLVIVLGLIVSTVLVIGFIR